MAFTMALSSQAPRTSKDLYDDEDDERNPAGHALKVVLLAVVLVAAAIAAYVYFGEKPPVAAGEVLHLSAFPVHAESNVEAAAGMPAQAEKFDEVLVLAEVKIHNQSTYPLFVQDMWADLTLPSGETLRNLAVSRGDFRRAFIAYPQLAPAQGQPIEREATIAPGETLQGMMLFHYNLTKEEFDKKTALDVSMSFLHQKNLTMRAPQ